MAWLNERIFKVLGASVITRAGSRFINMDDEYILLDKERYGATITINNPEN